MMRLARESDGAAVHAIFKPIIERTAISFATECPTPADFAAKIKETTAALPWLVEGEGETVLGYAYAGKHRTLGSYRWAVETSIYVAPEAQRRGVAHRLYAALLEILKRQGYYNAYAGITLPNEASVALHESFGFKRFCVFESIGHKLGQWRDVAWFVIPIQGRYDPNPQDPTPLQALLAREPDLIERLANAASASSCTRPAL